MDVGNLRRRGLIWVLLCAATVVLWSTATARNGARWIDFRAVYSGTRCLIHHHNPYNVSDLEREYLSEDGPRPPSTPRDLQGITRFINVPTSLVVLAPFAALSWEPALVLWMLLTGCAFILATLLMWNVGARYAPRDATLLACILLINCDYIFTLGNTGGLVVGLCGIAVWCFLEDRFVKIGVLCLAIGLAVKPHDAGPVWLYFVLAGGTYRKRALQSLVITAAIGLAGVLWVSQVAPHWIEDWRADVITTTARGGINDPGPNSINSAIPVIDLQAAISIFRDDPRFYNIASYLICGALMVVWSIRTLRARFSIPRAWLALAAAVPITLLITYHRPWDADLVMLAIPACCMLRVECGRPGKTAILITSIAAFLTGKVPLVVLAMIASPLHSGTTGILATAMIAVLTRPASLALLAMGIFYLWAYVRDARSSQPASQELGTKRTGHGSL